MPAEIVFPVTLGVVLRFLGDVEHVALPHQLLRLFIGICKRFGNRGAAAIQEPLVHVAAEVLPSGVGSFGEFFGALCVLRWFSIAELNAGILRAEIGRIVSASATTAGRDHNEAGQYAVSGR